MNQKVLTPHLGKGLPRQLEAALINCSFIVNFVQDNALAEIHKKENWHMKFKTIQIDCEGLTEKDLHKAFKEKLGFPDFYGMNWNALIDCLSYLREPEAKMTEVCLEEDEVLLINCNDLSKAKFSSEDLVDIMEWVNAQGLAWFDKPFVFLCPIESSVLSEERARIKEIKQLNRDSICAADDVSEHKMFLSVPSDTTMKDFIWKLRNYYLRDVWKGQWTAWAGDISPNTLGDKLFVIDTKFPCKVDILSDAELPEKIYFKYSWRPEPEETEVKESFNLYREGRLSKIFKIRNQ